MLKEEHHTEISKEKIKNTMKGHIVSNETREKMKESHKGKHLVHSGSFKKGHKINIGRKHSEEQNKKRRELLKGKIRPLFSQEWKDNISKAKKGKPSHWKGKKRPEISECNKKRQVSEKTRNILKDKNKLIMANKINRDRISKKLKGIKRSSITKQKMREWHINNPNRIFKDTGIELKMEEELKKRGINYEKQQPLCNIAIVDFLLPEYKIIIQCDGDYWHNLLKQKDRDINQDNILKRNDYTIYRFWEHEINENIEECVNKLLIRC